MSRTDKLSSYATTIASDGKYMVVTYHRTQIVKWNDSEIVLDFGGYDTVTTRRKMNQAANQFCLGFSVYRDKGETYVESHRYPVNSRRTYEGDKIRLERKTGSLWAEGEIGEER